MADVFDDILETAMACADDGTRDASEALREAFDQETERDWVLWGLMERAFNPKELMDGTVSDNAWEQLYDMVAGRIGKSVEYYIEDNTFTITFVDEDECWEDTEECWGEDEFKDVLGQHLADGEWLVLADDGNDVTLKRVEEEE